MANNTKDFFNIPKEQSIIKKLIVTKYFSPWATIMKSNLQKNNYRQNDNRIAYFDLFCGPGKYEDGTDSTPIEIMKKILSDDFLTKNCLTYFNDKNHDYVVKLKENLEKLDNYNCLGYEPYFSNEHVSLGLFKNITDANIIPTLSFIDPFGFKGISAELLNFLIRSFGCDLVLFFNYNQINRSINIDSVKKHISSIFTQQKYQELLAILKDVSCPSERENIILTKFYEAINNCYNPNNRRNKKLYIFPFRFQFEHKNRTSHYVIFLTKNKIALSIMKEIMWRLDNNKINQIASYEYIPNNNQINIVNMFNTDYTTLKRDILNLLKFKEMEVKKIINHFVETIYIGKNIKYALKELEKENKITVKGRFRKGTMPDKAIILINNNEYPKS